MLARIIGGAIFGSMKSEVMIFRHLCKKMQRNCWRFAAFLLRLNARDARTLKFALFRSAEQSVA